MSKKKDSGSNFLNPEGLESRIRRSSAFTPPPEVFEEPQKSPSAGVVVTGTASKQSVLAKKRRFSSDEQPLPIPPNTSAADLDFVDTLVQGSFAELVLVRRRDNNQVVVAKAFHHGTWRSKYLCQSEIRVFKSVNSPWLIAFYGLIEDLEEDFLLLEYLECGNFYQMMHSTTRLADPQIRFYSAEMFLAVDSLHQRGFMHRNIQLANFLLHRSGHLRICDFGLSYKFETEERKSSLKLITNPVYGSSDKYVVTTTTTMPDQKTPNDRKLEQPKTNTAVGHPKVISECSTYYLAPEVLRLLLPKSYFNILRRKEGYSYLCDYWSLGVAVYHMMYGKLPFNPDNSGCVLDKVLAFKKTLTFPMDNTTFVPLDGVCLVKGLLKKEHKRLGYKMGFPEIQSHSFFKGVNWDLLGHGKVSIPAKEREIRKYLGLKIEKVGWKGSINVQLLETQDEDDDDDDEMENDSPHADTMDLSFGVPLERDPSVKLYESGLPEAGKQAIINPNESEQRLIVTPKMQVADEKNKAVPSTSRGPAGQDTAPMSLAAVRRSSDLSIDSAGTTSSKVNIFQKLFSWQN